MALKKKVISEVNNFFFSFRYKFKKYDKSKNVTRKILYILNRIQKKEKRELNHKI